MKVFTYGTEKKKWGFTKQENRYINHVLKKFNYVDVIKSTGNRVTVMLDRMEVANMDTEDKSYQLFITEVEDEEESENVYSVSISSFKDPDETQMFCFRKEEDAMRFAYQKIDESTKNVSNPVHLKGDEGFEEFDKKLQSIRERGLTNVYSSISKMRNDGDWAITFHSSTLK